MEPTSEATPLTGRSLRTAAHLTAGTGMASAVLLLVSFAILGSAPPPTATDEALTAYYGGPDRRWVILAGLYVLRRAF